MEGLITEIFCENIDRDRLLSLPTLTLAHIGDGVYELLARGLVVRNGGGKVSAVHRRTVELVSAPAQAQAAKRIAPHLSDEERMVFLRGRNTRLHSIPKNAKIGEYAAATALETLFGWLYLSGGNDRIAQLWQIILREDDESDKKAD